MTEKELLQGCRSGDRNAQRELYDRTCARIYALLLKMTANPDDAFDLAQETYLKAFVHIDRFDGKASVSTWLYRIAVNEALQFLRRADMTRMKLPVVAREHDPHSVAQRSTIRLDVTDALNILAPTDRSMLLLRYQEGLDYRAIAEAVGCAEGTVGSRLNRARERMREILQESYSLGEDSDNREHPIQKLRMPNGE